MPNDRAPVAVFAFSRPDTISSVLANLERCRDFGGRLIYLFCDGPRPGRQDDHASVGAVRLALNDWARGKRAECIFSDSNRGLRASIISGVSTVLEHHKRVIVLEDDIVCSRSFLQYMDQAFSTYQSVENIWQISGFFVPGLSLAQNAGFLRMPACWGWGTWKDRWINYCDDAPALLEKVARRSPERFNLGNTYDFFSELEANATGRLNTWHVRWYASMFLADALALYPHRTLTRNIGFDSRGSNCFGGRMGDIYRRQRISNSVPGLPIVHHKAEETPSFLDRQIRLHRWQQAVWTNSTLSDRLWRKLSKMMPRAFKVPTKPSSPPK
jgi:hypothetical protein